MKMSNDKIGIVILKINWRDSHHQTGKTTHGKQHHESDAKQHRRFKAHSAFPHGRGPVKDLNTGRHGN